MSMQASWEHRLIELAEIAPHPRTTHVVSYWAGDAALHQGYRKCTAITREHSKSFHLASALLPEEKRSAVRALYAFCRTVDDIVDRPTAVERDASLEYWRRQVQVVSESAQDDSVAAA